MGGRSNYVFLLLSYGLTVGLVLGSLHNSFFWDTVQLGSLHANFYQSVQFSKLLLPDDFDSGHIPAFGIYIALVWELFGKSLISSHLAMLPFAIGIVFQLNLLCKRFIRPEYSGVALLMILIDPTLMSQITLVSPDVPLAFFFLLGWNAVLNDRKLLIVVGVFFLFLTSMRGMMVSLCLLLADLYVNTNLRKTAESLFSIIKRSLLYLPAFLIFAAYNWYHFIEKGWFIYHENSPWADCFAPVDVRGFAFNVGILGWRLVDFGRIGIWMVFGTLAIAHRKQLFKSQQSRMLLGFFFCLLVVLPLNMLWAKNLLAHRYLMPVYIAFAMLTAHLLFSDLVGRKAKILLSSLWIIILLGGNWWIYPDKISKGWDSTLAHHPYYELRKKAIAYLDQQQVDFNEVATFFPNTAAFSAIDLSDDERNFDTYSENAKYVFYSNIYNIDDPTYDKLLAEYEVVKTFSNNGIYITIYKFRRD